MAHGPYSRIYHELADDYPEVWDSPLLADFTRLLVAAEQSYPTRAKWASHASARAVERLAAVGIEDDRGPLVTLYGTRYTMKGLDGERGRRMQKASNAARRRWSDDDDSVSTANGNAHSIAPSIAQSPYRRDETRRDETRRDEHSPAREDETVAGTVERELQRYGIPHVTGAIAKAGEAITGHGILSAGEAQLTELDRLVEDHGESAVIGAMQAVANGHRKAWRPLVWDAVKVLEPFAPPVSAKEQRETSDAEAARERSDREYRKTQDRLKDDPLYRKLTEGQA